MVQLVRLHNAADIGMGTIGATRRGSTITRGKRAIAGTRGARSGKTISFVWE